MNVLAGMPEPETREPKPIITVTISGPPGVGKSRLVALFHGALLSAGCVAAQGDDSKCPNWETNNATIVLVEKQEV